MQDHELSAWLRLVLTPGVGNQAARKLLAAFGLPQHIFAQGRAALQQVVPQQQADALQRVPDTLAPQLDAAHAWLATPPDGLVRRVVTLGDALYPAALLQMQDPPLLLYVLGQMQRLQQATQPSGATGAWPAQALAIVGSRNPTPQGRLDARQFAHSLCSNGMTIVSGLALGIDGAAHEGALDTVEPLADAAMLATIAVIGTGIDRVYPRRHQELARRIAANGLIVSEYPLGSGPLPGHFPRRNRLIAGLSRGTLVVEAALRSGSLITARLATEQGKEVFAIPGSIHSPLSRGCHALIRDGAKLVESMQDILEELAMPAPAAAAADDPDPPVPADNPILQAMGSDPVSLDALQARTGLDTPTLQARLLELELAGHVARMPGGLFQRLARA